MNLIVSNEINTRISLGEKPFGHTRPIKLHLIKPPTELPLDPELYLNHITTAGLIDLGYAHAKQYLSAVPANGLPLQPETLMMNAETKPGVSFRETMTGGFSLASGSEGRREKGRCRRNKIIAALRHRHSRRLPLHGRRQQHSTADHSTDRALPLGIPVSTSNAIFNLFRPGEDPKTKYFVYEAGFEHEGVSYYLAGRKRVHDDPGFDMWADITTLFTLLHKSKRGFWTVVGAGVIYIKREQLMGLIPTFRATNTSGPAESLKVLGDFGRFFMGEIWDSYSK